jgi:4-diphosphocytidyl-2-C-methyl-D-erythritol kinase
VTSLPAVEIAPAKINLALHVRRRRSDGRHDIETIFAFCTDGDRLTAELADDLSLTVTGPFAAMIDDGPGNLVHRAASALAAEARVGKGVRLTLDKRLPVASGIGGGSADAAAALRLLTGLWGATPQWRSGSRPR